MMSRVRCEVARVQKKTVWRRDAKTIRIRAREETGCERRDVGRAVPFRGGFRVLCFFSSNLLFWVFFVLVSCHHHHHPLLSLHEQQRSVVKSTLTDVFGLLLIREKQQQRHRVYVRGVILGYKRARTNQHENTSLIKLENVPDKSSTAFYLGKKLCYVYKAHTKKQGTVYRTMWGKVTRAHGTSGVVRAQFKHNLPPTSIGGKIRCMLYPSNI